MNNQLSKFDINGNIYFLRHSDEFKVAVGSDYNYIFNKKDGSFLRFGKTKTDDPSFSPIGPEIADIEVTTICNGINGKLCPFCYKGNTPTGTYMTFETFQTVFSKFPQSLTQIAFGADSECKSNPDIFKMMDYSRANGVIPNITISNITKETAEKLAAVCGAVSVSRYDDKNVCYDSVKLLTDAGLKQVNIHLMVSAETFDKCMETIQDSISDPRLKNLNAIVLLGLKKKGRGISHNTLDMIKFKELVDYSLTHDVSIGFDSCNAFKFLKSVKDSKDYDKYYTMSEPCESLCFSIYVNVDGKVFPCSFTEGESCIRWGDQEGLDLVACNDFFKDVWYNEKAIETRNKIVAARSEERNCFHYEV